MVFYEIIIRDEFGNEETVCEAPKEFVRMVLNHKEKKKEKSDIYWEDSHKN